MAEIYRAIGGKKFEKWLADDADVQDYLEVRAREAAAVAEANLLQHRLEGHATIEVINGDVDWYVVLSDDRGMKAAMSIEYGRAGYIDEYGRKWGAMDGLYILHDAFNLARKARAKVRMPKRRKPKRDAKGRFLRRNKP